MTNLDEALKKINRFITFEPGDRENYMKNLESFTKFIIKEMKEQDEVFKKLYNGHYYQGSYFDNLKITKPNEYDIILQLKLPQVCLAKIIPDPKKPGDVQINITEILEKMQVNTTISAAIHKRLTESVDSKGFLDQRKISSWFQSMLSKLQLNNMRYKYSQSGPAQNFVIYPDNLNGNEISIDYVPGFVFDESKWPSNRRYTSSDYVTDWLAIPKPDKSFDHEKKKPNISFRSSFSGTERNIIWDKNELKNSIKLLKKLRDKQNVQNIKSYHIKTLFLWENEKNGPNFWNKPTSFIFMHMFDKLIDCVEKGELKFFWDLKQNMFGDLTRDQISTMAGQLKSIYNKIKKHRNDKPIPNCVYEFFLTEDEITVMDTGGTLEQKLEQEQRTYNKNEQQERTSLATASTIAKCTLAIGAALLLGYKLFSNRTDNR